MNISVAHRYVSMYCNVVRKKALAQWAGNGKISQYIYLMSVQHTNNSILFRLASFKKNSKKWRVLFEIMQNHHLLCLPKSAYFYIVIKSNIDQPSKRTRQNSSILWK